MLSVPVLLSFLSIVAAQTQSSTCVDAGYRQRTYGAIGDDCDTANNLWCAGEFFSWSGGYVNCVPSAVGSTKGKCVAQNSQKVTEPCKFSTDCAAGLWCKRDKPDDNRGTCTNVGDKVSCEYDQWEAISPFFDRQCQPGSLCMVDNKCHVIVEDGNNCVNSGPNTKAGADKAQVKDGAACPADCKLGKCTLLATGSDCYHDTECQTGACYIAPNTDSKPGQPAKGKCVTPKQLGDPCTTDQDCYNPLAANGFGAKCWGTSTATLKCGDALNAPAGSIAISNQACGIGMIKNEKGACVDPSAVYCLKDSDCGPFSPLYGCNCATRRCYYTLSGNSQTCSAQMDKFFKGTLSLTKLFETYYNGLSVAPEFEKDFNALLCCLGPGEALPAPPAKACPVCSPKQAYQCLSKYFATHPTFKLDMCQQGQEMMKCWKSSNCGKYAKAAFNEIKNNCFVKTK